VAGKTRRQALMFCRTHTDPETPGKQNTPGTLNQLRTQQ
jgi:hypothetical protein